MCLPDELFTKLFSRPSLRHHGRGGDFRRCTSARRPRTGFTHTRKSTEIDSGEQLDWRLCRKCFIIRKSIGPLWPSDLKTAGLHVHRRASRFTVRPPRSPSSLQVHRRASRFTDVHQRKTIRVRPLGPNQETRSLWLRANYPEPKDATSPLGRCLSQPPNL